ncbi:hypothetical protein [Saccharothrix australiensis]|uniref:Uncharacterized protein n=1 Tax=Saccharothrix australiensis TaxID=2072 RepID=A0A495VY96_9PSEU|nr:hypothetical protein [Saccharothrix australiensis]RKT53810.1 hypothetical protein C8E97_2392 [Saccharothrix australiensis]
MDLDARLHLQAAVWGRDDNRIAVLLAETEPVRSAADPTSALVAKGLGLVTDLARIALPRPPGWHVDLGPAGGVTVRWPHPTPLVSGAALDLPGVWRWAARRTGVVVLLAGGGPGVCDRGERTAHPTAALTRMATTGALAGGAVPFRETR